MRNKYLDFIFVINLVLLGVTSTNCNALSPLYSSYNKNPNIDISNLQKNISIDINEYNSRGNINAYLEHLNNTSALKVDFSPLNDTDSASLCWDTNINTSEENQYAERILNLTIPIKISVIAKGIRGNEWLDFNVQTEDQAISHSTRLSTDWMTDNFYIYTNKQIKSICLVLNSYKNPVGAVLSIKEIKMAYGKNVDTVLTKKVKNTYIKPDFGDISLVIG